MARELVCVGLSYRTAPLELRERLAFPDDGIDPALRELVELPSVGEAVLVSTCNRVEIYATTRAGLGVASASAAVAEVRAYLASSRKIETEKLAGHLYERVGPDMVKHVFRVASSLDSLVVGEAQILGQLKAAYGVASSAGTVGPLLGRCLERAFGVAKRVRSETAIAEGAANVASVAVELAGRIFGSLEEKVVLLIGAGKMSDLAARHLRTAGAAEILVTNRTHEKAVELARAVDGQARPFEELDRLLAACDVVISSTGAREPIITKKQMKGVMKARKYRPIFLVDIAVPRDVDPDVGKLDGAYVYDIDDLQRVVNENLAERRKEADGAEAIVVGEAGKFLEWARTEEIVPTLRELRERVSSVVAAEVERALEKLDPAARAAQEKALRRLGDAIIGKLLHGPTMALKHGEGDMQPLLEATRRLFGLGGTGTDGGGS